MTDQHSIIHTFIKNHIPDPLKDGSSGFYFIDFATRLLSDPIFVDSIGVTSELLQRKCKVKKQDYNGLVEKGHVYHEFAYQLNHYKRRWGPKDIVSMFPPDEWFNDPRHNISNVEAQTIYNTTRETCACSLDNWSTSEDISDIAFRFWASYCYAWINSIQDTNPIYALCCYLFSRMSIENSMDIVAQVEHKVKRPISGLDISVDRFAVIDDKFTLKSSVSSQANDTGIIEIGKIVLEEVHNSQSKQNAALPPPYSSSGTSILLTETPNSVAGPAKLTRSNSFRFDPPHSPSAFLNQHHSPAPKPSPVAIKVAPHRDASNSSGQSSGFGLGVAALGTPTNMAAPAPLLSSLSFTPSLPPTSSIPGGINVSSALDSNSFFSSDLLNEPIPSVVAPKPTIQSSHTIGSNEPPATANTNAFIAPELLNDNAPESTAANVVPSRTNSLASTNTSLSGGYGGGGGGGGGIIEGDEDDKSVITPDTSNHIDTQSDAELKKLTYSLSMSLKLAIEKLHYETRRSFVQSFVWIVDEIDPENMGAVGRALVLIVPSSVEQIWVQENVYGEHFKHMLAQFLWNLVKELPYRESFYTANDIKHKDLESTVKKLEKLKECNCDDHKKKLPTINVLCASFWYAFIDQWLLHNSLSPDVKVAEFLAASIPDQFDTIPVLQRWTDQYNGKQPFNINTPQKRIYVMRAYLQFPNPDSVKDTPLDLIEHEQRRLLAIRTRIGNCPEQLFLKQLHEVDTKNFTQWIRMTRYAYNYYICALNEIVQYAN